MNSLPLVGSRTGAVPVVSKNQTKRSPLVRNWAVPRGGLGSAAETFPGKPSNALTVATLTSRAAVELGAVLLVRLK